MASKTTRLTRAASEKNPKKKGKSKETDSAVYCAICEEIIIDQNEQEPGQDSIYCEGKCDAWVHRHCAGLTVSAFRASKTSSEPFHCLHCKLDSQANELASLRSIVCALQAEVSELRDRGSSVPPRSYANVMLPNPDPTSTPKENVPQPTPQPVNYSNSNPDRKFNLVVYGAKECVEGTNRHERLSHDVEVSTHIFQPLAPGISLHSIRDCVRLGKYNSVHCRPLLVKLTSTREVSTILANRAKLVSNPTISIKPDMTKHERVVESVLLKERRSLINSGLARKSIRIRGNTLYVNNTKLGSVIDSNFVPATTQNSTVSSLPPASTQLSHSLLEDNPTTSLQGNQQPDLSVMENYSGRSDPGFQPQST